MLARLAGFYEGKLLQKTDPWVPPHKTCIKCGQPKAYSVEDIPQEDVFFFFFFFSAKQVMGLYWSVCLFVLRFYGPVNPKGSC